MTDKQLKLESLFLQKRLQTDAMDLFDWCIFIVYFPFGCLLAITRFALVFLVALVAPEKYRYKLFRTIGGLWCKANKSLSLPKNGALVLSNHCNYLDPIVLNAAVGTPQHFGTVIWHGVNFFSKVICRPTVSVLDKGGNRAFLQQLYKANAAHNMIVFPEGTVTDNVSGLLQFQRSVFRLKQPIYLVAIKYHKAFPFINGKALSKSMGIEVLIDLFQPWTQVELTPLGLFERPDNTTPQQQADLAQQQMANALGLTATRFNKHDRHKLLFPE